MLVFFLDCLLVINCLFHVAMTQPVSLVILGEKWKTDSNALAAGGCEILVCSKFHVRRFANLFQGSKACVLSVSRY